MPSRFLLLDLPAALISLVLVALATGVEVGGNIQPSRVLVICALVLTIGRDFRFKDTTRPTKFFFVVCAIWIAWGVASLLWTPDILRGMTELLAISLGMVSVFTMIHLMRSTPNGLSALRKGWIAAFALTIPVALWEILMDHHLPQSYGREVSGSLSITYAAVTFGNRNTYAAFITTCMPFILWGLEESTSRLGKVGHSALMVSAVAIMIVNSSRLGAAAILLQLLTWLIIRFRNSKLKLAPIVGVVLVLCAVMFLVYDKLAYTQLRYQALLGDASGDASVVSRTGLLLNGLFFIQDTWGMGVGAGGFSPSIINGRGPYFTGSGELLVVDPHNVWIELFSQYGMLVGTLVIAWFLYCFRLLWRHTTKTKDQENLHLRNAAGYIAILMVGLIPTGAMNSAYLRFTIFWMAIAAVAMVACSVDGVSQRHLPILKHGY
jgi:O-antigen ligase